MYAEHQYLKALQELVDKHDEDPTPRKDRTGTGTYSVFGRQWRFPLMYRQLPLLTTKRLFTKGIVTEMLWFLRGDTNVKYLHDNGVHIWDEWADEHGELGPVYGAQWRAWPVGPIQFGDDGTIDQIANVIKSLRENPGSRRHIVTAWNPAQVGEMALPPCHCLFQFYVEGGWLDCQLYMRSADIFLGVPFNIASYGLLTHLIARETGLRARELVQTFGDLHLYANHVEQAKEQLAREPRACPFITIEAPPSRSIFELEPNDIRVNGYNPHPAIKAEVSV